jgi:DNA-binding transcriptional LysR family regulator
MAPRLLEGIDLNLLLALHALLEERHVTRAAARLGITQSAMSRALSRLRVVLGDPLFIRTAGGMVATARAQELAEPLARGLTQVEAAIARRPSFDPKTAKRLFRIGVFDYGEMVVMPPLLAKVSVVAPNIELASVALTGEPLRALEEGKLDLAIGLPSHAARNLGIAMTEWPGIYAQHLFDDRFVCLVREGHPTVKRTLSLEAYAAQGHVVISPFGRPGSFVDRLLADKGLRRKIVVNVSNFVSGPLLVASSDLLVTVPERVAKTFAPAFELRVLECPLEIAALRMHQMWHERHQHDPAHAWLRTVVAEAVAGRDKKRSKKA